LFQVNADIYFDETLHRLRGYVGSRSRHRVLALMKWKTELPTQSHSGEVTNIGMLIKCDSQDAWIFRAPIGPTETASISAAQLPNDAGQPWNQTMLNFLTDSNFYLGAPRCDNRIAAVLTEAGYEVTNPAMAVRAIEAQSYILDNLRGALYGLDGQVLGTGRNVFVTDEFVF
jgi:hypothetical protein